LATLIKISFSKKTYAYRELPVNMKWQRASDDLRCYGPNKQKFLSEIAKVCGGFMFLKTQNFEQGCQKK
jgi:hypothetical protein